MSQHTVGVCVFGAFLGIIGLGIMTRSQAASFFAAAEPENGTATSAVAIVNDATASGGRAVKFGAQPAGFVHPGIHLNKPQLDFVKARITQEPWLTAFNKTKNNFYSKSTRIPTPVSVIKCGNGGSTNYVGCEEFQGDAVAAYNNALLWYYTGDQAYANKAISFMNAWSSTLTSIPWDGTSAYGNNKLVAGWAGSNWTRAAEIIRYSNAGWASADIDQFETMLTSKILPLTIDGWSGGAFNWMTLLADVTISIGVFTDNKATFDNGIGDWRVAVPAHIYLTSDGPTPIKAPYGNSDIYAYWFKDNSSSVPWVFNNGQTQETCRDLNHTAMGLASIFTAAETARIQGIDLYGEQQTRLMAAMEFQAGNYSLIEQHLADPTFKYPSNICQGDISTSGNPANDSLTQSTGEIALNHYVNRKGLSMPKLQAWMQRARPVPQGTSNLHMQNETLTNVNSGSVPAR